MAYFYLYYGDYVADNGANPEQIIENAKDRIQKRALEQIKIRGEQSQVVEQEFEKLYGIQPEDFAPDGGLKLNDVVNMDRWRAVNADMTSFDASINAAVAMLKEGIEKWNTRSDVLRKAQDAINNIDAVLRKGAETQGLTDGAMAEARKWKKNLQNLKADISVSGDKDGKGLAEKLKQIAGHVSGALLEIAFPYAFLTAAEKGLSDVSSVMMNIGGHSGPRLSATYKQDPKIAEDIQTLRSVMKNQNKNVQTKADSVLTIHDSVTGTTSWVGFQQKNYKDIKNIKLAEIAIRDLTNFFEDDDFLINTAGGLGYNHRQDSVYMPPSKEPQYMQKDIDILWREVMKSFRLAAAADAIAGFVKSNFTNQVHYYVIRNKKNAGARVVGVSSILNRIWKDFNNGQSKSMGFSAENNFENEGVLFNFSLKTGYREAYWKSNVENFRFGWPSREKYARSAGAAPEIWKTIQSAKMKIALDFSAYFGG